MDQSSLNVGIVKIGMYYYMAVVYKPTKDDTFTSSKYIVTEFLVQDDIIHQIKDVTNDPVMMSNASPVKEMAAETGNYGRDKVINLFQHDSSHYATSRNIVYKNDVYELVSPLYKQAFIDLLDGTTGTSENIAITEVLSNILKGVLLNEPNRNKCDRLQYSAEA